MNYFRQNPFYDPDLLKKKFGKLEKKYSSKVFSAATKIAHVLNDDSDADKLSMLCSAIAKSGTARAGSVAQKISHLSSNSTKRTFEYAEELLSL